MKTYDYRVDYELSNGAQAAAFVEAKDAHEAQARAAWNGITMTNLHGNVQVTALGEHVEHDERERHIHYPPEVKQRAARLRRAANARERRNNRLARDNEAGGEV
jgi:hypothetical protein